jgi:hypothetical protein
MNMIDSPARGDTRVGDNDDTSWYIRNPLCQRTYASILERIHQNRQTSG